jgi:hypothetical protein
MFDRFPTFITTQNGRQFLLTDILRRSVIDTRYRTLTSFLIPYTVRDGETPEQLAFRAYGNSFLHWVILLVNGVTNPMDEWPLPSSVIVQYVHRKYPFTITVPSSAPYLVGDVLTTSSATYTVTRVSPGAIEIQNAVGRTFITTETTFTNTRSGDSDLPVVAVSDPEETPHHWEDAQGNWVDASVSATPVSNLTYEMERNDMKRAKYILDPQFIETFVKDFEISING